MERIIGHYTQIIGDDTYAVGCGAAKCGNNFYMYCNYASGQSLVNTPYLQGKKKNFNF